MIRCSPLPPMYKPWRMTQQYWEGSLARDQNPGSNGGERDVKKKRKLNKLQWDSCDYSGTRTKKTIKKTSKKLCCQIVTKNKCTALIPAVNH